MKTSELMIGDLVNLGYRDLTLKVLGLDSTNNVVYVEAQDNFKLKISYDEEEIKSIPLTDEILKLNGFEQNGDIYFYYDYLTIVDWKEKGYRIALLHMHPFCFTQVHELQHILRVLGFHDLANNFKIHYEQSKI